MALGFFASAIRASAIDCFSTPTNLAGWWPGDGNANNILGTNHGTLFGGATASAVGFNGQAFTFDGVNAYVEIPDSPALKPTNLTIEAWVRFSSLDGTGTTTDPGQQYIVFKKNTRIANFEGYDLGKSRVAGLDYFAFRVSSSAGAFLKVLSTTVVTSNVWYHVAAVRGSNFLQLYVNGALQGSTAISFPQDYGTDPVYFGTSGQSWDRKFAGTLDEVALYSRAISSNEIAAIYAAGAVGRCKGVNIAAAPQSQTVLAGTNAQFSVTATGFGALNYQWRFSGTNLPGATATNLTFANVQSTNAGNYAVVVTNSLSSVTSAVAVLTVAVPPGISTGPQSVTTNQGANVTFSVTAIGTAPLSYQWRFGATNIGGATGSSYTRNNAQPADAGNYSVVVTNAAGSITSAVASLTINIPPGISVGPQHSTNNQGANVTFSVTATGTAPLAYQWRFGATNIGGATGSSYARNNAQPADAGNYSVVVTNAAGSITSAVAGLTINVPPGISVGPQNATNSQGADVTFSVTATGTAPLSFQWRFGAANIGGATGSSYTRSNAQPVDAGNYSVVVTNVAGSITSSLASLTINVPPGISVGPQSQTNNQGADVTFNATATGTAPLSYQWRFGVANIGGATGSSYTRSNAQPADAGNYSVVVTNMAGSITSSVANLTVNVPPGISVGPQSSTNNQGADVTFSVTATGTAPLSYQWRFGEANIGGAMGSSYTRSNAQPADVGNYSVVVTNVAGAITSSVASLTINLPPGISVGPQGSTNNQGDDVTFSVIATGTSPLSYQWRFGAENLAGATGSSYTRSSAQPGDAGNYSVVVTNVAGAITSSVASLTINVPPGISVSPQSSTNNQGSDVVFSVTATGTSPLSYQWQFGTTNIGGATGSSYTRSNAQPVDAGNYFVVVTNVAGAITSSVASLTINVPPGITVGPQSSTNNQGADVVFNVTATGTSPLSYQWRFGATNVAGATGSSYTRSNVQPADAGNYSVVVANVAGSITSSVANLTVNVPPGITADPQSTTNNQGANVTFNVTATGTAPLSYQWRFNASKINGATFSSYTRNSVQPTDAGSYTVVVTNVAGSITSAVASLSVNVPPGINVGPQSTTNNQGADVTFNVTATGTAPLSYQWRFNTVNIGGATGSSYTRSNAQPVDAGSYTVVVTNLAGSTTSGAASLTVNVPPGISVGPQSATNNQGADVTFNVTATGTAPLSYQWRFGAANIGGATSSSYTRSNAQPADVGNYSVVVTNVAGSITSGVANLTVNVPPGISVGPQSTTNNPGADVTFSVTATGTAPLAYQWRFGTANIGGATGSSYTRNNAQPEDAGNYSVVVTNVAGAITSSVANLTINGLPGINVGPQSQTNNQGDDVTFSVTATGTGPLSYQWQFGAVNIGGATGSSYTRSNAQPADAGNYSVVVTNVAGSITSSLASLTINVPPGISVGPQSTTNNQSADVTFNVTATGTAPLAYQWRFGAANIGGATGSSYTRSNAQPADAGNYTVVVTNVAGAITSSLASLTVNVPPGISVGPQSQTNNQGADVTFNVTATGTAPLAYQWRFGAANIGGATGSSFTRSNAQPADAGNYSVVVTNVAGAITSSVASLTINTPPVITAQPQSRTNITGSTASFSVTAAGLALNYQWRFYGTNLSGATGTNLTLVNVQSSDAGNYTVLITNVAGSVTSAVATLTVLPGIYIPNLIPDPNLSNAVYLALGKTNGPLLMADLVTLTNLHADFRNVTNLSGLSDATNLTRLTLSGNAIGDLSPLQNLKRLASLELDKNSSANLTPLLTLTNLTSLVLGGNPLGDLSVFSGLSGLTNLSLARSSLTNLAALQFLPRLSSLAIRDNQVADISPLAALTNLTQLDLRQNSITNYAALAGFTNLTKLCLGWNFAVSNVSFVQNLRQLTWLDIGYSAVSDLSPLAGLTNLAYLVASGNPLASYGALSNLSGLVNLELRGSVISNATFLANLPRLNYADLHKAITNVPALGGLTNLRSFVLAGVQNFSSLAGLNLTNLWLGESSVSNVTFFTNLPKLSCLVLDDNFITDPAPLKSLTNLTRLGLSRNPGNNSTSFALFTNLTALWLDGNGLTNVSWLSSLTRLEFLSLRTNRVTALTGLEGLTNLVSIYADRNRLTNLSPLTNALKLRFVGPAGNLMDTSAGTPAMAVVNELKGWGAMLPGRGDQVEPLSQNKPPGATATTNLFITVNESVSFNLTLSDDDTAEGQLIVTAVSSNPALIPNVNLALGGANALRTLTVTPASGQSGTATITITVTDEAGTSAVVTVLASVIPPASVSAICPGADANLLAAIALASGKVVNELTTVDLLRLDLLSVNNANLANTCIWPWATNLTGLYLVNNSIPSLSFLNNLPHLNSLGLFNSGVADYSPLTALTGLTTLNLNGSTISNLTFLQGLTGLNNLTLDFNKVAALAPLTGLTNLASLSLKDNRLAEISPLAGLPQLAYLNLSINMLDIQNGSPARTVIQSLENGGTFVVYSPQREPPFIDVRTNWVINANSTAALPFTVVDTGASQQFSVGAVAANPGLLPVVSAAPGVNGFGTLTVTSAAGPTSGTTLITLSATNEVGLRTSIGIIVTVTVFQPVNGSLLNSPGLTWTGSGSAPWFGQSLVTHDGVAAAQSGAVGDNQFSSLQTTVNGPGLLTYWHKISSETNYDYLDFYVNDVLQTNSISGEVNWQQRALNLPAGSQTLKWIYARDKDTSTGADAAWLDEVKFIFGASWLEVTQLPIPGPLQLKLHVATGQMYEVQRSTNLLNWLAFGSVTATNTEMFFYDTNAATAARFYRLRGLGDAPP